MSVQPESLRRHRAYLSQEEVDRPLLACNIGFYLPECYPSLSSSLPKDRAIVPDDIQIDLFLQDCERLHQLYDQVADDYPFVAGPFIYLPWMEAIMGCPIFAEENSMWAAPAIDDWDKWQWDRASLVSNPWFQKLLALMEALVEHADGRYPVAHTLMRGPADMLSAMRGATRFPLDFYDFPDEVSRAADLCAAIWIEVAQAQLQLIPDSSRGYMGGASGLRSWTPDKIAWLQEDAMALLSPRFYRDHFLPLDRRIADEFPWAAFHLHGSALWAINDLVVAPELDIVELNYESAQCDVEGTFTGWRRIQEHKPLIIWKEFSGDDFWLWLERVAAELSPRGLSIQVTVSTVDEGLAVQERIMGMEWEQ
jgi:hypothetical protein